MAGGSVGEGEGDEEGRGCEGCEREDGDFEGGGESGEAVGCG